MLCVSLVNAKGLILSRRSGFNAATGYLDYAMEKHLFKKHPMKMSCTIWIISIPVVVPSCQTEAVQSPNSVWTQQTLNLGSMQVKILLAACQRFVIVVISDNGPG